MTRPDYCCQLAHSILETRVRSRKPISLTFYQDALQDVEYLHQLTGRGVHLRDLLGRINEAGVSTDSTFSLCPYAKNQKIDLPGGQINDLSFFEGAILFKSPTCWSWTCGGFFELTWRPSRALNLALHSASRTTETSGVPQSDFVIKNHTFMGHPGL